jgi:hypothetical protein
MIFESIIERTVKVTRSLHLSHSATLLISEEGSGTNQITKISIHLSKMTGQELLPATQRQAKDTHRSELKQIIKLASVESKVQVVLHIREPDLAEPGLLDDLNAITAHGDLPEIFQ